MNLDRKTIAEAWKKVRHRERYGHTHKPTDVVLRINVTDEEGNITKVQDVTYKNIKKYLRKL